jgi:hypothetical protein
MLPPFILDVNELWRILVDDKFDKISLFKGAKGNLGIPWECELAGRRELNC